MKYLFSHDGLFALSHLVSDESLFALDFDGTLASIVPQPALAAMSPDVRGQLERLAEQAPVAIVSGRRLEDLSPRLPESVSFMIGNHGNEGLQDPPVDRDACLSICAGWMAQIESVLAGDERFSRVMIEPKGLTLSVHYRRMQSPTVNAPLLADALSRLLPRPRLIRSPLAFNLLPQCALCKDDAVGLLARRCGASSLLYVGDDENDEMVFAHAPLHWVTVRIGESRPSAARYFLRYQAQIRDLLMYLNRLRRTEGLRV